MLLSGQKPFRDNNNEALQKKIMSGKYDLVLTIFSSMGGFQETRKPVGGLWL